MTLDELFNLDDKKLNSLKKEDIVKCISSNRWAYNAKGASIRNLQKDLEIVGKPYDQAKLMLLGFLGVEVEKNEYSGKPKLEGVDLCFLIGRAISHISGGQ